MLLFLVYSIVQKLRMVDGGDPESSTPFFLFLFARFILGLIFVLFWQPVTACDVLDFLLEYACLPLPLDDYLTVTRELSVAVS